MNNQDRPRFEVSAFWRLLPVGMRRRWWLFRLFDLLARSWPAFRPRRGLLVIRMDGIGDMVLFRASLDHYAEVFGVAAKDITVLGCESWSSIAEQLFAGYRVITINEHAYAKRPWYRFKVNLMVRRIGAAITVSDAYFRRALMADSLAWVANAPRTVVSLPYINEPTRSEFTYYLSQVEEIIDTGPYPTHEIDRHFGFLSRISGVEIAPTRPRLNWPDQPSSLAPARPYAVLNPGSNEYGRRWPLENYLELAGWLQSRGLAVVFVGKGEEKAGPIGLDGVVDLTGRTSVPEILDLINGAALVVSNDTGPAHLAIGLDAPTVVIVGGGHFGCFVPYPEGLRPETVRFVHHPMDCYHCFWRCHKRSDPMASFPCVAAVSMDQVQAACAELLG
mgnify:CR=1 FL=1